MIRSLSAAVVAVTLPLGAAAQAPAPADARPKSSVFVTCAECGVVSSIKRIERSLPPTDADRAAKSGLVASIPLDGGKALVGSSTDVRHELKPDPASYEIVVRLDDGRFQLVRQDDAGNLREGDKVRIERGKAVLRDR